MEPVPKLRAFMLALATHYQVDLAQPDCYLRLEKEDEYLLIESCDTARMAIAHWLYLYDTWLSDPGLVLWTQTPEVWIPVEASQIQCGHQMFAEISDEGELIACLDSVRQLALAAWIEETVVANLIALDWYGCKKQSLVKRIQACESICSCRTNRMVDQEFSEKGKRYACCRNDG